MPKKTFCRHSSKEQLKLPNYQTKNNAITQFHKTQLKMTVTPFGAYYLRCKPNKKYVCS